MTPPGPATGAEGRGGGISSGTLAADVVANQSDLAVGHGVFGEQLFVGHLLRDRDDYFYAALVFARSSLFNRM